MATFTVTTRQDELAQTTDESAESADGNGLSLREAIALANDTEEADEIVFSDNVFATGDALDLVIVLLNEPDFGQLEITEPVTIDGGVGDGLRIVLQPRPEIRAIRIEEDAETTLSDLDFREGSPRDGDGGGAILSLSDLTLNGVSVTDARTSRDGAAGGAVFVDGDLAVRDSSFTDNATTGAQQGNTPATGGAIHATGDVTLTNTDFTGNLTEGGGAEGGAVWAGGALEIDGGTFSGNATEGEGAEGGAAYGAAGVGIANATFTGNQTGGDSAGGGAVWAEGALDVTSSTFTGNETAGAASPGGALRGQSAEVADSALDDNQTGGANSGGGAIFAPALVTLSSVGIAGNATLGADSPGGAVRAGSVTLVNTSGDLTGNSTAGADSPGGAIAAIRNDSVADATGNILVTGAVLRANETTGPRSEGGALHADADATIDSAEILDGRTAGEASPGGGLFARGNVSVADSTFRANATEGDDSGGGAIATEGGARLTGSTTLQSNATAGADSPGGALSAAEDVAVIDSTVADNATGGADSPGGGLHALSGLGLLNATVSGNATAGDRSPGGGLWAAGAATLANATVAANGTEGVGSTGGGIHAETVLNLLKSTVTGNLTEGTGASGGGLWAGTSRLAGDSIVLGNAATGSGAGVGDAAYGPAVLLTEIGENILGPQDADPAEVFAETVSLVGAIRGGALAQGEGEPLATVALLGQSTNPAIDTGLVGLLDEGDRGLDLNGDGDIADRISTDARGTGFPRDIDIAGVGNDGEDFGDLGAVEAARTNRAPIGVDDEDDLLEDAQVVTINVLANDSDPDSTAPLEIVSIDAEGVLGLAEIAQEGTRIVYRPQGLFESLSIGETSVQALDYTIEDEDGGTATATLRLTVIGVNDFPDAADDTAEIGARAGETEIDVLANDSDPDRLDSLEVLRLDTDDTQGAARIAADGLSVFYDPSGAFPDLEPGETTTDSFSYTITDGNGVSVDALVTVTLLGEADTNTPPVAVDDTASVPQWAVTRIDPLADNGNGADDDPDGDSLAVTGLGDDGAAKLDTGNGIALLAEDGTVFYRSERDFVGVDRFDYAISDGAGGTDTATVSVVVEPDERGTTLTLGEAQRVAYAYEAALDRDGEIELVGLNFWIGERFDGLTERGLARAFYESPEFEENYGEIDSFTDRALVEVFYRNVLDRDGEESGIVFWTGVLERPGFTREDLLIAFAESPENLLGSPQITTLEQVGAEEWAFA